MFNDLSRPEFETDQENAWHHLEVARENRKERLEGRRFTWERVAVMITAVMVAINSLFLIIYRGQLKEMIKATEAAEQSARAASAAVALQGVQMRQNQITEARQEQIQSDSLKQSQKQFADTLAQIRLQVKTAQDVADAAKSAATTAQETLEIEDRPWVTADVRAEISYAESEAVAEFRFTFHNTGKSLAKNIRAYSTLVPGRRDPLQEQNRLCNKPQPELAGFDLFPNDLVGGNSINRHVGLPSQPTTTTFNFVGCIDYRSTFDPIKPHQTRFNYVLKNDGKTEFPFGKSSQLGKITLERDLNGNYAY